MSDQEWEGKQEDTKQAGTKSVPYYIGTGPRSVYPRLRDFMTRRFSRKSLLIIRIGADFTQDHRVFNIGHHSQLIHWDNETYDIEHEAIIKDHGHQVMYIVKGCRKPIDPHAWVYACESISMALDGAEVPVVDSVELETYGRINLSARTAWLKMNNRDAAILSQSGVKDYSRITAILAAAAVIGIVVLVAQSYGVVPSKTGVQMDYIIQVGSDLMEHYGIHLDR